MGALWLGLGLTLAWSLAGCDAASSSGAAFGGAPGFAGASGTAGTASVRVTVSGAAPRDVARTFFGQNYWSWVKEWGDPVALTQEQVAAVGLGLLRAGGANNDNQTPEPFSDAEVLEFLAYATEIGAEPLLQVPVLKNPSGTEATAEDAAALVNYVNGELGAEVRHYSIGNEPDLYTTQGHADATFDAVAACAKFRSFAEAMKGADPSIEIWGPDLSHKYTRGNDWLTPFLNACGDAVDVIAVHRYPFAPAACTESNAYADLTAFRQTIRDLRAIQSATGVADKPLAITEANITYDGAPENSTLPASPGTFPAALWLADNLGVGLEEGLANISYWSLSEGWTLGFFDGATPRPAFHVLALYAQRFGSQALQVTGVTAPQAVSVYAGRTPGVSTNVFVVNKTNATFELNLNLVGLPLNRAPALSVPAESLTLFELRDNGNAPRRIVYTRSMSEPAEG